jgi:hypothetical protein
MGLTYSIEKEFVTVLSEGSFDVEHVLSTFSRIRSECDTASPVRILIVDRGSAFDPTPDEIQEFVGYWSALFRDAHARIALVVEKEVHFGLGRMAAVYADSHALPFRVFRSRSDADRWLLEGTSGPAA